MPRNLFPFRLSSPADAIQHEPNTFYWITWLILIEGIQSVVCCLAQIIVVGYIAFGDTPRTFACEEVGSEVALSLTVSALECTEGEFKY